MIRVSIIVIVLLIVSIDAKPMNKLSDEHMKEMVVSTDDDGKLFWGVMVEPPEDLDRIQFEVDPSMKIWNSMKNSGQDKHYLKPEEDRDEIYHPSTSELQAQMRKFGYQTKEKDEDQYSPAWMEHSSEREVRIHLQPEEDIDDLYHKQPLISVLQQEVAEAPADLPSQRKYAKPEEDLDDIYHKKLLLPVLQQEVAEAPADLPSQRKYTNPEEDLDDIYHKKLLLPVLQQEVAEAPADLPSQKKYAKPEEDLDDIYHKKLLLPVLQQEVAEAPADLPSQRKYTNPEEDLDDIYHKKLLLPVLQQEVAEAPADRPSQRKYTNPEEDLDGLYHK